MGEGEWGGGRGEERDSNLAMGAPRSVHLEQNMARVLDHHLANTCNQVAQR